MNIEELLKLMPKRRLTRSQSVELFFKLDQRGKPTIEEILNKSLLNIIADKNLNSTLTSIEDPEERAEAYKELCIQLKTLIYTEREENIKHLTEQIENVKRVIDENKLLRKENESHPDLLINFRELVKENELLTEQLLNSKALIEQKETKLKATYDVLQKCENADQVALLQN